MQIDLCDEAVEGLQQRWRDLRFRLLAMKLCVVLQAGQRHIVVDGLHTGVIAHKGGHLGGSARHAVYTVRINAGVEELTTDVRVAGQCGEMQRRVVRTVLIKIDVGSLLKNEVH